MTCRGLKNVYLSILFFFFHQEPLLHNHIEYKGYLSHDRIYPKKKHPYIGCRCCAYRRYNTMVSCTMPPELNYWVRPGAVQLAEVTASNAYRVRGCCFSFFCFAIFAFLASFCFCPLALTFLLFLSPMEYLFVDVVFYISSRVRIPVKQTILRSYQRILPLSTLSKESFPIFLTMMISLVPCQKGVSLTFVLHTP